MPDYDVVGKAIVVRLNSGLRLSDEAEPFEPAHHREDKIPPKGDECPKRAAYVDEVVRRYRRRGGRNTNDQD